MSDKQILLYYFKSVPNLGDILNISIIEKVFNKQVSYSSPNNCSLVAIGSILNDFTCYKSIKDKKSFYRRFFSKHINVWGTGFIEPEGHERECFIRKMKFLALRGKLSLERVKNIDKRIIKSDKIVLGDPGLLSSCLISKQCKKKYSLGIIPHYVDKNNPFIGNIVNRIKNSTVIDVCRDPIETVQKISECELIISSAMHGLIAADSLNIPNVRIKMSDLIRGGDYKYKDYYSAYDIEMPRYIDLREQRFTIKDLSNIASEYKIKKDDVNNIRDSLYKVFPFK